MENQKIDRATEFDGHHEGFILFELSQCDMAKIPLAVNVLKHMLNLKELFISHCNISQITKQDLEGFGCLTKLKVAHTDIEELPFDLFGSTRNLMHIDFSHNKIIHIGDSIMEPLKFLNVFDLTNNPKINIKYYAEYKFSAHGLRFREAIKKCKTDAQEMIFRQQKREIHRLRERKQSLYIEVADLKKKLARSSDQAPNIQGMAKDFKITVNEKEFEVSKVVMATRSKRFARLIDESPGADEIKMGNIRTSIFEAVLEYISNGKLSDPNINPVELFAASLKLEMEDLKALTYHMLLVKVDPETALDVLRLCNKYEVDGELKEKAFEEYKKNFPTVKLSSDLMSDSEKLIQLMEVKVTIDGIIQEEN